MSDMRLQENQQQEIKRIKLESMYPYTFVRVTVMRSKLISSHDYAKLVKMQFSEIARFLQDTEYKTEIDELAVKYGVSELLELALTKNLVKTFKKLNATSSPEMNLLINAYLMKYDILNIKTIVRGLYTKADRGYVKKLLIPAGTFTEEFLDELQKKQNIEEIIRAVPFIEYKNMRAYIDALTEKGALFEFENALDKFYQTFLVMFTEQIPREGNLFREFLLAQIQTTNILTIARLMKEGMHREEIAKFAFMTGIREIDVETRKLLMARNIESLASHLANKSLKKFLHKSIEAYKDSKSLVEFERLLSKRMLDKSILFAHQHPLSIDVILGYMFAKEIEIQNLMKLVKGKELGLDEAQISKEIVTK